MVVAAPVSAIRSFLAPLVTAAAASPAAPGAAGPPAPAAPWLGIRVEPDVSGAVHGVRVAAVAPSGPADRAGLRPTGDIIVAVDGQPVVTSEALADAIAKHAVGETVKLLVFGGGKFREVDVALRQAP